jgi:hypothetical protein
VYHCWSRCVRRAFLCGNDPVTGQDFEYRRDWICQFEERLAGLFGIEVAFRGELSNHIHLILRTRPDVVALWSDEEVARRWLTITHLVRSKDGQTIKELADVRIAMETANPQRIDELRGRLASVSYFMGALCEHIARRSNLEDRCRGSFWILQLLDTSGRIVREGKRDAIPDQLAPILARLGVNATLWGELITQFDRWFGHVAGKAQTLTDRAASAGRRWYCGRARCADAFG